MLNDYSSFHKNNPEKIGYIFHGCQGLIQKEKVHIDFEKGAQITFKGTFSCYYVHIMLVI